MFGEFARIAVRGTGTYGLWRSLIAIVRIPDSSLTLCQVRKVPNSEVDGFTQHRVGAAMLVAQQCLASRALAKTAIAGLACCSAWCRRHRRPEKVAASVKWIIRAGSRRWRRPLKER